MLEHYLLAKQTVSSKYSNHVYYPLLVVGLFSLLEKYKDYEELVLSLFQSAEIVIEEDSMSKILARLSISFVNHEEENNVYAMTSGLSSGENIVLFQDGDMIPTKRAPLVICSSLYLSPTIVLNIFLHEMNHLIKGSIQSFYFHKDGNQTYYACRTGLHTHYYHYDKDTGNLWENDDFNILDEVINTIQSTELVEHVFSLKDIVMDEEIQNYLASLSVNEAKKDFGYENVTRLLRPLWEDEMFREIIESHIVDGNISFIIGWYEEIMGKDSFDALSLALEIIDEANQKNRRGKKYRLAKKYINNAVKQFPKGKRKILC